MGNPRMFGDHLRSPSNASFRWTPCNSYGRWADKPPHDTAFPSRFPSEASFYRGRAVSARAQLSATKQLDVDSFLGSTASTESAARISSRTARKHLTQQLPQLHPRKPIAQKPNSLTRSLRRLGLSDDAVGSYIPAPLRHVGATGQTKKRAKKEYQEAVLTPQQEQDIVDSFKAFDRDGSGNIDASELRKAMFRMGSRPTKEQVGLALPFPSVWLA